MTGKQVPNAELEVLACLNRMGLATARQIREAMLPYRPMTHGSVFTLLTRLEVKGLVTKEKGPVGKAYVYSITKRGGKVFPDMLHWFVQVFAGDSIQFVASIFDINPPDGKQVKDLKKLISDLKRHVRTNL